MSCVPPVDSNLREDWCTYLGRSLGSCVGEVIFSPGRAVQAFFQECNKEKTEAPTKLSSANVGEETILVIQLMKIVEKNIEGLTATVAMASAELKKSKEDLSELQNLLNANPSKIQSSVVVNTLVTQLNEAAKRESTKREAQPKNSFFQRNFLPQQARNVRFRDDEKYPNDDKDVNDAFRRLFFPEEQGPSRQPQPQQSRGSSFQRGLLGEIRQRMPECKATNGNNNN